MKKSLLALAVLGAFAGVASAQSSVTIYGSLDLAVAKSNGGTAGNNACGPYTTVGANTCAGNGIAPKAWNVQQSNASRLGFRGNEDLGGGLSAQFQIEHRFNPDTGAAASTFWSGRSYVQLSSATAGRVYLGRDYAPTFWPAVKSDPFGWDGVGQMGLQMFAGFTTPSANSGNNNTNVRTSNTVGYKSPSFGGLTAQVAVGLGEGQVGRDTGLNVEYGAGPIYAAFGYEKVNKSGVVTDQNSKSGDSLWNAALHYDFGVVKPMFYYSRAKDASTGGTNKFYSLGLLAPVGGGTIKAAYYRFDVATVNINAYNASYGTSAAGASTVLGANAVPQQAPGYLQDSKKFAIGYDYALSKRTNVYADVGLTRADTKTNNSTYAFGVKHTF